MFQANGKYGNIHIDGMSINIEKTDIEKLEKYIDKLEIKREQLIQQQNDILSQIIN